MGEKIGIEKTANEHNAILDVSDLANGVYLIEIETNQGSVMKRLLISR